MKVIFLDVDGVLNSEESFIENHEHYLKTKEHKAEVDENMVRRLSEIIKETNAIVVMSSSWRGAYASYKHSKDTKINDIIVLDELFVKYNINVFDYTPKVHSSEGNRGTEIRKWLSKHKDVEKFILIDDEIFSDFNELIDTLIKTEFYGKDGGLQNAHVIKAIELLNK